MPSNRSYRLATAMICSSLLISSSAANASASISPWATLSAFGTQSSRDAACSAGSAAAASAAAAAQAGGSGCVLPVTDAVAPPPVAQDVPLPPPPVETGGIGISPLVLALGALALAGLIYIVAKGDDDEGSPLSPP
ncbi:MAG TPA: hypothetical protein VM757_05255 [Sphingomicrobium sp.]|nr:hypothetical protein [Sphingomicrobium sp.]